jgi:uncharacterized protein (DUF697 family)/GTP-binding protein EngB required for normal cell division
MLPAKFKKTAEMWREMLHNFDWEETREDVNRESQARIVLLGLPGAGKSTLFNQLCGWAVSNTADGSPEQAWPPSESTGPVEDYGLFCLVDLDPESTETSRVSIYGNLPLSDYYPDTGMPDNGYETGWGGGDSWPINLLSPLELAEAADLIVYVVDGTVGVQAADYRWVGRLRRLGHPLLVVLNKNDALVEADIIVRRSEMEARLATGVISISAQTGAGVKDELLPKMVNLCAKLTVALGRELGDFRQQAATRIVHRAALLNGVVALEPVPLIDLPVQIITLTGMILRIGAAYDRPPTDVRRREVVVAVACTLLGRYAAQQLAKFIPIVGWLISGAMGWASTQAVGRAAITYFEAGGDGVVDKNWQRVRAGVGQMCRSILNCRQRLPRRRLPWRRRSTGQEDAA